MVKNQGGNKSKKGARRLMVVPQNKAVREKDPKEPCEMYASMVKLYGGSNCEVICEDGVSRLCVIRSKFRGRGKQDNFLSVGSLLLIGLRDWEVRHPDKKENCDLLCVYRDDEKIRLRASAVGNWGALADATESKTDVDNYGIIFENGSEADVSLVKSIQDEMDDGGISSNAMGTVDENDEIDIDDI